MTLRLPTGLIGPDDTLYATLAGLLPSVLAPMGVPGLRASPRLQLAPLERTVVLMVDGLGSDLLSEPGLDVPVLRSAHRTADAIVAGFPTSTAVSITSIATGVRAGEHGIVGYTMAIPEADVVLECLSWRSYDRDRRDLSEVAVPETIQPVPTLAARARAARVEVTVVSYAPHAGSALTRAALRGARYVPIPWEEDEDARLAAIAGVLAQPGPQVVYTYYAGVDQAGHEHGIESDQWEEQVRQVDALVTRIVDVLPAGSRLIVTADHGMVDVDLDRDSRIDLAVRPDLARGISRFAGDPRMRHLHVEPDEAERVADRWRAELGWTVCLLTRDEAIDGGLFGPVVRPEVRGRIGDLLVLAVGPVAFFDSRVAPGEIALTGHHGSLTGAELFVPALEFVR